MTLVRHRGNDHDTRVQGVVPDIIHAFTESPRGDLPGTWSAPLKTHDGKETSLNGEQIRDMISEETRLMVILNVYGPHDREKHVDVKWEDLIWMIGRQRRLMEEAHSYLDTLGVKKDISQGLGTAPLTLRGRIEHLQAELQRLQTQNDEFLEELGVLDRNNPPD